MGLTYGTRLSTIILVKPNGEVVFVERDIWAQCQNGDISMGNPDQDRRYTFSLQPPDQVGDRLTKMEIS